VRVKLFLLVPADPATVPDKGLLNGCVGVVVVVVVAKNAFLTLF